MKTAKKKKKKKKNAIKSQEEGYFARSMFYRFII